MFLTPRGTHFWSQFFWWVQVLHRKHAFGILYPKSNLFPRSTNNPGPNYHHLLHRQLKARLSASTLSLPRCLLHKAARMTLLDLALPFAPNLPRRTHLTQNKIQHLYLGQWGPIRSGPPLPLISSVFPSYALLTSQSHWQLCWTVRIPSVLLPQSQSQGCFLYL